MSGSATGNVGCSFLSLSHLSNHSVRFISLIVSFIVFVCKLVAVYIVWLFLL